MRYPKLEGRIKEFFKTHWEFAEALGINPSTLSKKLQGKSEFKKKEIVRICELLGIPFEEIPIYFFAA